MVRFWLPVALVLGAFEVLFWTSGESWPLAAVVRYQKRDARVLFLRGSMGQAFQPYKFVALKARRPRVVVLGSSRVMEFRAEMFGASSFYNAGGMIQGIDDLHTFLRQMPCESLPRVILLGVDEWWFNANVRTAPADMLSDPARSWAAHLSAMRKVVRDPAAWKPLFRSILPPRRYIGLEAVHSRSGFRADGSFSYDLPIPPSLAEWQFVDHESPPIPDRLKRAAAQFPPARGMDAQRLAKFEDALQRLRDAGVLVIGFAPPFSAEARAILETDPRHSPLWTAFRQTMPAAFARAGFPWFDASATAALGIDDRYLIDGFHSGEMFDVHLLEDMLLDPRVAAALPGAGEAVRSCLNAPASNFWFIGGSQP